MAKLSFNGRRAVVGIALAVAALTVVNYLFKFGWFGGRAKDVMILGGVLLFVAVYFIGPTMDEMREYRARMEANKRKED